MVGLKVILSVEYKLQGAYLQTFSVLLYFILHCGPSMSFFQGDCVDVKMDPNQDCLCNRFLDDNAYDNKDYISTKSTSKCRCEGPTPHPQPLTGSKPSPSNLPEVKTVPEVTVYAVWTLEPNVEDNIEECNVSAKGPAHFVPSSSSISPSETMKVTQSTDLLMDEAVQTLEEKKNVKEATNPAPPTGYKAF